MGSGVGFERKSGCSHPTARFAAMLFQQLHIGDRHAAVHGFAHVVNGQKGEQKPIQINDLATSCVSFARTPEGLVGQ